MDIPRLPDLRRGRTGHFAAMALALLVYMAFAPASAMEVPGASVLEAADHGELTAYIPASGVSRIALLGDRVARVVRAEGGLRVEHDPVSGDLYLHPAGGGGAPQAAPDASPSVLFIGTERGFTYRLSLAPSPAGAVQILIRNPAAAASPPGRTAGGRDDRVGALVGLIRAVVRREPLPGYVIEAEAAAGGTDSIRGFEPVQFWRGPRFTAMAFELGAAFTAVGAETLAGRLGPGIAAAWISAPSDAGVRLAVAVRESTPGGESR